MESMPESSVNLTRYMSYYCNKKKFNYSLLYLKIFLHDVLLESCWHGCGKLLGCPCMDASNMRGHI